MSHLRPTIDARFSVFGLLVFVMTACAPPESWTLVEILFTGESEATISEDAEVRNCGAVEQKSVTCSAGTSSDLSVGLGASIGGDVGLQFSIDPSVSGELGIGKDSGETLDLETPPKGYIYRYTIDKEYRVLAGNVLARSSTGRERETTYSFHASCSLSIASKATLACDELPEATESPVPPPTDQPFDCESLVTSSRPLQLMDTGNRCWLKVPDGSPAVLIFNQPAQVTFGTWEGGDERYFFIANPGDELTDVYGGTIRSISFVNSNYGGIDQVREFEANYHSPGGGFPTCLRDRNNGNSPLTSLCR